MHARRATNTHMQAFREWKQACSRFKHVHVTLNRLSLHLICKPAFKKLVKHRLQHKRRRQATAVLRRMSSKMVKTCLFRAYVGRAHRASRIRRGYGKMVQSRRIGALFWGLCAFCEYVRSTKLQSKLAVCVGAALSARRCAARGLVSVWRGRVGSKRTQVP
jgi:hypothetical protein